MIGTVKFYNDGQGFGFIEREGGAKDAFVHKSTVKAAGLGSLSAGQRLYFDVEVGKDGLRAVNFRPA